MAVATTRHADAPLDVHRALAPRGSCVGSPQFATPHSGRITSNVNTTAPALDPSRWSFPAEPSMVPRWYHRRRR